MPRAAKQFAFTIIYIGAFSAAFAAALWTSPSLLRFLACLCLALLGSTFKVKLPGMEGCISPSFVPLLFSVGTSNWQETIVMAGAAGIVQSLWRAKKRPQIVQVLFNGATLAIAMGCAYAISHSAAPGQIWGQLAIAVTVFEAINTLSVSTVICLVMDAPLSRVWRNCHLWTFPFHLAGAGLATVWIQSELSLSLSVTFLGALTMYLLGVFYQELVSRTTAPSTRVEA